MQKHWPKLWQEWGWPVGNTLEFAAQMDNSGFRAGIIEMERLTAMATTRMEATMAAAKLSYADAGTAVDQIAANRYKLEKIITQEREEMTAQIAIESEKVAAAEEADAARVAANRQALEAIVSEEREAGIAIMAEQDAILAAQAETDAARVAAEARTQAQILMAWHAGEAKRIEAEAATAAAIKAEQLASITSIARAGGLVASELSGGHGGTGISGIIGETLVLFREMGRANFARVPGSLTILAQRLGLLGIVIKSTAAAAIIQAEAEDKLMLSTAMAARAAAAKAASARADMVASGAATAADIARVDVLDAEAAALLKVAIAQKEVTAAAIENAEVAKASAVISVGAWGWILAAVIALGIGMWVLSKYIRNVNAELKNFKDLTDNTSHSLADYMAQLKSASESHQAEIDRLHDLAKGEEDYKTAIDETLKSMSERAKMEHELAEAKGMGRAGLDAMDIDAEQKRLDFLTKTNAELEKRVKADKQGEKWAENEQWKFNTDIGPNGGITLSRANANLEDAAKAIDAAKEVMARTMVGTGQFETKLGAGGVSGTEEVMRPANESDVISFKVGDKKFTNSVSQLTEAYDKERAEVLRLSDIQRAIADRLKDKKKLTDDDIETQGKLQTEADNLASDLKLKREFLPKIAAAEAARSSIGKISGGGDSLTRVGNFLGSAKGKIESLAQEQVNLQRETNRHLHTISANTSHHPIPVGNTHGGVS